MKLRPLFLFALTALSLAVAPLNAQELAPLPTDKPGEVPTFSPSVESAADAAQQQLFKAADQPSSGPAISTGPTTTGRRASFVPPSSYDEPASWAKGSKHKLAVMEISLSGNPETVMFELFPNDAPRTVVNFIENCESGVYKDLAFHRAIQNFLVQTGDPLTADEANRERWGTGGDSKTIPAEIKRAHRKGAVGMGRRADNVNPSRASNGSQFYFSLGNYGLLDGNYTVFGQVVSGLDVIERIARMPVDSNDCPLARIEVKSIKVIDHTGPLVSTSQQMRTSGRKYTKPAAAKGFLERFLERVW